MTIKLVVADVDGTLVTRNKTLTRRTCEAVDRLRARGIDFTITSGRPPRGLAGLIAPLKLNAPVAGFNGGVYVKPDLTTVLAQRTIPPAVARHVVDYLLKAGLDVWVYRGADWYIRRPNAPRVARERSNVGFEPTLRSSCRTVSGPGSTRAKCIAARPGLSRDAYRDVPSQSCALGSRPGAAHHEPRDRCLAMRPSPPYGTNVPSAYNLCHGGFRARLAAHARRMRGRSQFHETRSHRSAELERTRQPSNSDSDRG